VRLPEFLQQQLQPKEGIIIEIPANEPCYQQTLPEGITLERSLQLQAQPFAYTADQGKKVGQHHGAHYFTIGQRKGLNVGGTAEPLFIIATDVKENIIYTGQGQHHPGLFRQALHIQPHEIHWIREDLSLNNGESMPVEVRIRYRQPLQKATLYQFESGLYIAFEAPQSAITQGQFAAWYCGEELLGSGVISS
jgi:tRNA-specific 2-thiouridylase